MGKLKQLEKHLVGWLESNKNSTIPDDVKDTYESVRTIVSHVLYADEKHKYWEAKCRITEGRGFAYANSVNPNSTPDYAESQLARCQVYDSILGYMKELEKQYE